MTVAEMLTNPSSLADKEKGFFLLLFAGWCGHCMRFRPIFEATCLSIAAPCFMVDAAEVSRATMNEFYPTVTGFPTLLWRSEDMAMVKLDATTKRDTDELTSYFLEVQRNDGLSSTTAVVDVETVGSTREGKGLRGVNNFVFEVWDGGIKRAAISVFVVIVVAVVLMKGKFVRRLKS